MAVQAQYPSNILLLNRKEQESKNIILGANNFSSDGGEFVDQSHLLFNNNGVGDLGVNQRKRSREVEAMQIPTRTTISSFNWSHQNHHQQNKNHQLINLSQLQNHHQQQQQQQHSVVSTGLKLSFGEQFQHQNQQQILHSQELTFQFKQHNDELNYFLNAQGEHMRRVLTETRQRHYRALLDTIEATVAQRLQEKEGAIDTATRLNAELQARMAQIISEAQSWQAEAEDKEVQAMSLQAQIQQDKIGPSNVNGPLGSGPQCGGDSEDAESTYTDPTSARRVGSPGCKACHTHVASILLLPCRHLCICAHCDERVQACPVCYSFLNGSIKVQFT